MHILTLVAILTALVIGGIHSSAHPNDTGVGGPSLLCTGTTCGGDTGVGGPS